MSFQAITFRSARGFTAATKNAPLPAPPGEACSLPVNGKAVTEAPAAPACRKNHEKGFFRNLVNGGIDYVSSLLFDERMVSTRQRVERLKKHGDRLDTLLKLPKHRLAEAQPDLYRGCRDQLHVTSKNILMKDPMVLFGICSLGGLALASTLASVSLTAAIAGIGIPVLALPIAAALQRPRITGMVQQNLAAQQERITADLQAAERELTQIQSEIAHEVAADGRPGAESEGAASTSSVEEDDGYLIIDGVRMKQRIQ